MSEEFYVVSDLHIHTRNKWWNEIGFATFWKLLMRGKDIYYAGDIADELMERDPLRGNKMAQEVMRSILHFADKEHRYAYGNHDNEHEHDIPSVIWKDDIAILHGNQWDKINSGKNEKFSDTIVKIVNWADRNMHTMIANTFRKVRNVGWERRGLEWAKKKDARMVICGHSHRPGMWIDTSTGTKLVVCGDWKHNPPYIVAHYKDGDCTLEEIYP